jgi:pimeloyl-ACP methyl ester carboxylesterase
MRSGCAELGVLLLEPTLPAVCHVVEACAGMASAGVACEGLVAAGGWGAAGGVVARAWAEEAGERPEAVTLFLSAARRAQGMLADFLARAASPDPVALLPAGPADRPVGAEARHRLRRDLEHLSACEGLPAGWPLAAPVLLVEAGADAIVAREAQERLRHSLPAAHVLVFPEAGHALLRAPLIPAVLEWLQRTLPV